MRACFGNRLHVVYPSRMQQRAYRWRVGNAIPRVETLVKIRPSLANRIPERRRSRFEEVRPPRGNGESASGADDPPKRPDRGRHVGDEEDAEYAHHRIELRLRDSRVEHVRQAELDVLQPASAGFGTCQCEQVLREINAEDKSVRPDLLR